VLDVAVDIRKGSPTYGQHVECLLCAHDEEGARIANELKDTLPSYFSHFTSAVGLQFFVPRGFAHGFAVLSETAVFQYKCDEFYHPEADGGISILDDTLGIDWRISDKAILSEKDTKHPLLKDFDSPFDIKIDLYK
jgi:dTDP-4-dehydrorhamnose 3,5-epimerase